MEIIFLRHAVTRSNEEGIIQGPEHGDVTLAGEEQIRKTAELLRGEKIDFIYSSDSPRCKTTAEGINKFHNQSIQYLEILQEKNNGCWAGKNYEEVNWKELTGTFEERKVPNGENLLEVRERAGKFVKEILKKHGPTHDRLLVVTHGAFLKLLIGELLCMDLKSSVFRLKVDHCTPIRVSFNDQTFENRQERNVPTLKL